MEMRIGKLISILYRKSQIYIGQALKSDDITSSEYPILITLNHKDGVTQEDLVSQLYLDKSVIARVIQTLELKGFVTKSKDENDQRCNRIFLTAKGYGARNRIEKALDDWNSVLMMDMEKKQQEEIYENLMQMVENIKGEFLIK